MNKVDNDLWIFIIHNNGRTLTRANVPHGITTLREMIDYIRRGGKIVSNWIDIPDQARFSTHIVGMTVLAKIET